MNPIDYHKIVDVDHQQQNPTSTQKLDRVIGYCDMADGQRVLDLGCGKGWMLRRIAEHSAIKGLGIDVAPHAIEEAKQQTVAASLKGELEFRCMPATQLSQQESPFDLGLCLGASFAIGSFEDMLAFLKPMIRPGGLLVIGDIYARVDPMPEQSAVYFADGAQRTLRDTADLLNGDDLSLLAIVDSSADDWDHFENLHWIAGDRWLRENPDHPDRQAFIQAHLEYRRDHYLYDRDALGWAIWVARVL